MRECRLVVTVHAWPGSWSRYSLPVLRMLGCPPRGAGAPAPIRFPYFGRDATHPKNEVPMQSIVSFFCFDRGAVQLGPLAGWRAGGYRSGPVPRP